MNKRQLRLSRTATAYARLARKAELAGDRRAAARFHKLEDAARRKAQS